MIILQAVGSLILLTAIYNLGIFASALIFKVRLEEFVIGLGKRILRFRVGQTWCSIGILPVAGYCRLADYSAFPGMPIQKGELRAQSFIPRTIIEMSGIIAVCVCGIFSIGAKEYSQVLLACLYGLKDFALLEKVSYESVPVNSWIELNGLMSAPMAILCIFPFGDLAGDRMLRLILSEIVPLKSSVGKLYDRIQTFLLCLIVILFILNFLRGNL